VPMSNLAIVCLFSLALAARVLSSRRVVVALLHKADARFGAGTIGVQLAKQFGAYVIATCSSASAELVKSLGADQIIDYRNENFTTVLKDNPVSTTLPWSRHLCSSRCVKIPRSSSNVVLCA
jgi:hypothetical protein